MGRGWWRKSPYRTTKSPQIAGAQPLTAESTINMTATATRVRTRIGIPMSITSKIVGRLATALLVFSGYEALRAAQEEYKACMNY